MVENGLIISLDGLLQRIQSILILSAGRISPSHVNVGFHSLAYNLGSQVAALPMVPYSISSLERGVVMMCVFSLLACECGIKVACVAQRKFGVQSCLGLSGVVRRTPAPKSPMTDAR